MHAPPFIPNTSSQPQRDGYSPAHRSLSVNVSHEERVKSLAGGGVLLALGLIGPRRIRSLSLLGGAALLWRGATGHCYGYELLGMDTSEADSLTDSATAVPAEHGVRIRESIVIKRPAEDIFKFWRDLQNLPKVMRHLESVTTTGNDRSHWIARGPADIRLEWDAVIHTEQPNEYLSWRSLPDSEVDTAGSVHFRPLEGDNGTLVEVLLKYDPPGGRWVARLASLMGVGAEQEIRDDLRRLKVLLEAG